AQDDPSCQAARDGQQTATAAPAAERATGEGIATVVDAVERAAGATEPTSLGSTTGLLSAGARDVVPAIGDVIGDVRLPTGGSTIDRQLTPESLGLPSIVSVANGISIIFKPPP